jgi:hypothetical protein
MRTKAIVGALAAVIVISGCGASPISADDLRPIVASDGLAFQTASIPDALLDTLASHRLVVIGESHLIREHHEFVPALLEGLHERGFRQVLLEWPHAFDWLVSDYAFGGEPNPKWKPPTWLYGKLIEGILSLNLDLAEGDRFTVRGIDVNLDEYGGATMFRDSIGFLSTHLDELGPIDEFQNSPYHTPEAQKSSLETLLRDLDADRSALIGSWGEVWYDRIVELAEVETTSIEIRTIREDDYDRSVRLREEEMKRLTDLRLSETEAGTLLNVGGNHAQKERFKGTKQEWLGDHLVHQSEIVAGDAIVVAFTAANIVADYVTDVVDYHVADESGPEELFRIINETWPESIVFLPFDNAVFSEAAVAMNYENTIYVVSPKHHYDAVIVYPLAHRIPLP